MYTCRTGQIVRFTRDNNFIPMWNMPGIPIDNMCTSFSAMGSAVVMPLRPSKGYEFEVAIFGGGTQVGNEFAVVWLYFGLRVSCETEYVAA
jgi:hypothetical protein